MVFTGRVQGVGFRPFVWRLAKAFDIAGWVRNEGANVRLFAEGAEENLVRFQNAILQAERPIEPRLLTSEDCPLRHHDVFVIASSSGEGKVGLVPKDVAPCPACTAELFTPSERRYRYPFIACAECGPRYSALYRLPYDRKNSTMALFPFCADCSAEYHNPENRRFHAEMIACPQCGPKWWLSWQNEDYQGATALEKALLLLEEGLVLAVKGIGGYHLLADATSCTTVARLRNYKKRPQKPLAILVKDLAMAAKLAILPDDTSLLVGEERPIILLPKLEQAPLAENVAPGLDSLGLMLPPTPLLLLLAHDFDKPLVATSANVSSAPMIYDNTEILQYVSDAIFNHDRPMVRPLDDAVVLYDMDTSLPVRPGRGMAPALISAPYPFAHDVLALGGEDKVALALGASQQIVLSEHIGHLANLETFDRFLRQVLSFPSLFGCKPQLYIADAHPGYASHQWLQESALPARFVLHHHAHAAGAYFAAGFTEAALVFTWDGTGFGADGTIWGGEAFVGMPGQWQRFASILPFALPGGEAAIKEPYRVAYALLHQAGLTLETSFPHAENLKAMLEQKVNTPESSAIGRLFDAVAVLLGLGEKASFDAELAMKLEALAKQQTVEPMKLPVTLMKPEMNASLPSDGLLLDWRNVLPFLVDEKILPQTRAFAFHAWLADFMLMVAQKARHVCGIEEVAFSGGVFQNTLLLRLAKARLGADHFRVVMPGPIAVNDAGLAIGQLLEVCHG